jgi:hypothetical protein
VASRIRTGDTQIHNSERPAVCLRVWGGQRKQADIRCLLASPERQPAGGHGPVCPGPVPSPRRAYGLDVGSLALPPSLSQLTVDGLRRSAVDSLRALARGRPVRLTIRGTKTDAWLEANLTNPFRDWVEDDARGGAAACRAYADTLRALGSPAPDGAERARAARRLLHELVDRLNAIERRSQMIDTVRRYEAWEAFAGLARRAGVPEADAGRWFDEWRDF